MKRFALCAVLVLAFACAKNAPRAGADAQPAASASAAETPEKRAARIHAEAIVVDTHNDIPTKMAATAFDLASDGTSGSHKTHTDLARMKAGGITAEFFSIFVDKTYADKGGAARRALDLIDMTYQQVERHKDDLVLATRADDIERAKRDRKIAVLMGIEGGHAIENSLFALRDF